MPPQASSCTYRENFNTTIHHFNAQNLSRVLGSKGRLRALLSCIYNISPHDSCPESQELADRRRRWFWSFFLYTVTHLMFITPFVLGSTSPRGSGCPWLPLLTVREDGIKSWTRTAFLLSVQAYFSSSPNVCWSSRIRATAPACSCHLKRINYHHC